MSLWTLVPSDTPSEPDNQEWSRTDPDGTVWTIRGNGRPNGPVTVILECRYRDHRLTSHHPDPDTAKQHCANMVRAWTASSLRDYARGDR